MRVGTIRKMIEGMSDDADVSLHMVSSPQDNLNVRIEDIVPTRDKTRLDIHVSIVTDAELEEEDGPVFLLVPGGGLNGYNRYYETDLVILRNSLEVPRASRYQWLLDHSQPVERPDEDFSLVIEISDGMDQDKYEQITRKVLET